MKDLRLDLRIVNLVATAELNQPVDLEKLTDEGGFSYDRAVYKCAYFKDRKTKSKVSIFPSGKLISIGTTSFSNATSALKAATERLAHLGMIKTPKLRPRIRNIVVVGDLGVSLDLESVSKRLRHVIYEPEQFPGALYFPEELEGSSITLFASGKVIVAGLKAFESIETCKTVLRKLEGFV